MAVRKKSNMKGMTIGGGQKRPTKKGAGMTKAGVKAYRRANPGSKLKTAVTGKVKKGSAAAKRRKSYVSLFLFFSFWARQVLEKRRPSGAKGMS